MEGTEIVSEGGERAAVARLIDAILALPDEPYAKPIRHGTCVAAVLDAAGTVWTERTVMDADGFGGRAHALRAAVSKYWLATDASRPRLVLAAIVEQSALRRQLVLPCGTCRELLAAHADPSLGLSVVGVGGDLEKLVKYRLADLLPYARGDARWCVDVRALRTVIPPSE